MNRKIFLDIETTGLCFKQGHKIIEIAAVEMIDRNLTGNNFHTYINPQRDIEQQATRIHKIQTEFLNDKPLFGDIANNFLQFIKKSDLIIHNADFDLGFLNHELKSISHQFGNIRDNNSIIDTLQIARDKYYGKKNSLDALCKRFDIDYSERENKGHGALLDAKILYEVYICMTSEQMKFSLGSLKKTLKMVKHRFEKNRKSLIIVKANKEEISQHHNFFSNIKSNN